MYQRETNNFLSVPSTWLFLFTILYYFSSLFSRLMFQLVFLRRCRYPRHWIGESREQSPSISTRGKTTGTNFSLAQQADAANISSSARQDDTLFSMYGDIVSQSNAKQSKRSQPTSSWGPSTTSQKKPVLLEQSPVLGEIVPVSTVSTTTEQEPVTYFSSLLERMKTIRASLDSRQSFDVLSEASSSIHNIRSSSSSEIAVNYLRIASAILSQNASFFNRIGILNREIELQLGSITELTTSFQYNFLLQALTIAKSVSIIHFHTILLYTHVILT